MSDQRVMVFGEWPDQTIWMWYDYASSSDYDRLSINRLAVVITNRPSTALVELARRRGTSTTTLHGHVTERGDLVWSSAWLPNGDTADEGAGGKRGAAFRRAVERSGPAIDYLLSIYYQKLRPNAHEDDDPSGEGRFYRVTDAPRRNPRRRR